MGDEIRSGDEINATISGPVQGQVAVGKDVHQEQTVGTMALGLSPAEREELDGLLARLREEVAANAPSEQRDAALERVDELDEALKGDKPDLTTMQYVKQWFSKNLPELAGAVTGVLVHPLVGKVVQAAGEALLPDEPPSAA